MLILHFCLTPLAAAPYRICQALNMLEGVTARSIVFDAEGYSKLNFPSDLIWSEHRDEILTLLDSADLLHLHNFVDLNCDKFSPIDFRKLWDEGVPMVRQFHSASESICNYMKISEKELSACPIPKLVISQFQERFYPNAKVVPNIVTQFPITNSRLSDSIRIGYSPSNFRSARQKRWDTKGYHETKKLLIDFKKKAIKQGLKIELDIMERVPFEECLRRKTNCDIVIDDLVTGSYHMSALEGLASGKVVLAFADNRVIAETMKVTNGLFPPIINVRLEEMQGVLFHLVKNKALIEDIKKSTRKWMELHWQPKERAQQFIDVYKQVILNPKMVFPMRYNPQSPSDVWFSTSQYDLAWKTRHKLWPKEKNKFVVLVKRIIRETLKNIGLKIQ